MDSCWMNGKSPFLICTKRWIHHCKVWVGCYFGEVLLGSRRDRCCICRGVPEGSSEGKSCSWAPKSKELGQLASSARGNGTNGVIWMLFQLQVKQKPLLRTPGWNVKALASSERTRVGKSFEESQIPSCLWPVGLWRLRVPDNRGHLETPPPTLRIEVFLELRLITCSVGLQWFSV